MNEVNGCFMACHAANGNKNLKVNPANVFSGARNPPVDSKKSNGQFYHVADAKIH